MNPTPISMDLLQAAAFLAAMGRPVQAAQLTEKYARKKIGDWLLNEDTDTLRQAYGVRSLVGYELIEGTCEKTLIRDVFAFPSNHPAYGSEIHVATDVASGEVMATCAKLVD